MVAFYDYHWINQSHKNYKQKQESTLKLLINKAKNTLFGEKHSFSKIKSYKEFISEVEVKKYEDFLPYIQLIKEGRRDILWRGLPLYFAVTSGTTAGYKLIPITKEGMRSNVNTARKVLLSYIWRKKNLDIFNGKMLFLQATPVLKKEGVIDAARLSALSALHVPVWFKKWYAPSLSANLVENWNEKIKKIIEENINRSITVIAGIPTWIVHFFEELLSYSGKKHVLDVFPELKLIIYGGTSISPYFYRLKYLLGGEIDIIETYPASESFIAYQLYGEEGMLFNMDGSTFFEFLPVYESHQSPPVLLHELEENKKYEIILSCVNGLWRYTIGDIIQVIRKEPLRIKFVGRTNKCLSLFGEHVLEEEIDYAATNASKKLNIPIREYFVYPEVGNNNEKPGYIWYIETPAKNLNTDEIAQNLDFFLSEKNIYYKEILTWGIIRKSKVKIIKENGFIRVASALGKLGGQNKALRLGHSPEIKKLLEEEILEEK